MLIQAVPDTDLLRSPLTLIRADLLIKGPADEAPVLNGIIVTQGGKIVFLGEQSDLAAFQETQSEWDPIVYEAKVVMPGMWDVHSHFLGAVSRTTPISEQKWRWCFEDRGKLFFLKKRTCISFIRSIYSLMIARVFLLKS